MKEIERELLQLGTDKSCILLLSGGIDSAILLFLLKKSNFKVFNITFNYNGRNPREIEAARKISELANSEGFIELKVDFLKEIISLYEENKNGILEEMISNLPLYYVPARNLIFISIAAYFAESMGIKYIFTGHVAQDANLLPDVGVDFLNAMNRLLAISTYSGRKGNLEVRSPFINLKKKELVPLAMKYDVPLEYTWSCHDFKNEECKKCKGCLEKRDFLNELNLLKKTINNG